MDLRERVDRLCRAPVPDRELRGQVLETVGRRIPFDAHVFALTDPVTRVVASPHATVPMVAPDRLPGLIAQRYARPGAVAWRAWLADHVGVAGVARVELRDRYGDWGFLELWRVTTGFADDELSALASLSPVLTARMRAAAAASFAATETGSPVDPGVVLLDADLRMRAGTGAAAEALLRLLPPDEDRPPVPAAAYNAGGALLAGAEAWTRVHLGGGRLMTVRAERIEDGIAVSISPCTAAERVDLFGRSHGLSPRERQVLGLVLAGQDSRSVAAALTIAPTTAEDHLKALLAKTGTPSRQHLLIRALGG